MPHPNVLQIGEFPFAQQDIIDAEVRRCAEEDLQRDRAVYEGHRSHPDAQQLSSASVVTGEFAKPEDHRDLRSGIDGIPLDASLSRGAS
ncbi:hypothetical protein PQQ84_00215 [Paraburkholderia strydomiana]|uniref:hypothetical protein n=1 Tax=Paraburkholderia strydomiana TaxID=1245417 RepID=UPI0038B8EC0A